MKRSDEISRQIADLISEAEGLVNHAQNEGRPLNKNEETRWGAIMDRPTGILSFLETELERAKVTEANTQTERQRRVNNSPSPSPERCYSANGGEYRGGDVRVISRSLAAFKGQNAEADAYDCGLWLRGRIGGDSAAMRQLEGRRGTTWLATQNENSPSRAAILCRRRSPMP